MKKCKVDRCSAKVHARKMCEVHYRRFMRLGTTKIKTPEDKFWDKVGKTNDCWFWVGNQYRSGYGRFNLNRRYYQAHRYSYEIHKGKIPNGLVIDHLCRIPLCVNPDHLEAVTNRENIARGMWKSKTSGMPPGVRKNGKKFIAIKRFNGEQQSYIGTFGTPEDAQIAYETAIGVQR